MKSKQTRAMLAGLLTVVLLGTSWLNAAGEAPGIKLQVQDDQIQIVTDADAPSYYLEYRTPTGTWQKWNAGQSLGNAEALWFRAVFESGDVMMYTPPVGADTVYSPSSPGATPVDGQVATTIGTLSPDGSVTSVSASDWMTQMAYDTPVPYADVLPHANNQAYATPDPGRVKMWWQNYNTGAVQCWMMSDSGTIKSYNNILSGGAGAWRVVGAADINVDGDTDLIWRHSVDGSVQVWFTEADGYITSYTNTLGANLTLGWTLAAVANISTSGIPSLIWQKSSNSEVQTWFMTAQGAIESTTTTLAGGLAVGWRIAAVADISGDGIDDLIWQNTSNAAVQTWFMNANGSISSITNTLAAGLASGWTIVGSGKVNDDNVSDLIWQNTSTAAVQTWFMSADGSIASFTNTLAAGLARGWAVVGASDIDNDGASDLIWQNTGNYAVQSWFMSEFGAISSYTNTLAPYAATGWSVGAISY